MLEALTHSISETDFSINRANIVRWLRPFAATTPMFYLLFVIPFALMGYFALLLFPGLSVWLYLKLINSLYSAADYQHWPDAMMLGSFLLLSTLATIALARLGFRNPAGSDVNNEKMPVLFHIIKKLRQHYGNPGISRILITRDDSIRITHNPVSWFPVKFKNTLEIGMSALLCTSPLEFRGMLAREIAKLASQKNPVTGWMLSLHRQWAEYHYYLERSGDLILKPLTFFFRYYSPLYNTVSFFAARRAEIRTDRYTLEVMEDDDAITSMIQAIIFQNFLREKYWPKVLNQPKDGKHRVFLPYKKMSQTIRNSVKRNDIERWVEQELRKFGDTSTTLPPLKTRLHLLGHIKPVYPPALEKTAAEHYLDFSMQQLLINSFDKSWMRKAGMQAL
ncbi:MAG TPA: hypothetical protein ENG90_01635 [Gammaproteobacteria bacterium]|nr:hypothetical protein BMS3Abin11_02586 [bacterium BMS3Abin11]GMT41065.1 MAG: hypothetical protein IEMM0001_1800 [bacterium]HDH15173.1 hypothetical protein [Gammaproteobacteria bacterium]